MKRCGLMPNYATPTSLLLTCLHARMVDNGERIFEWMVHAHGMLPWNNHYPLMVDIYSRTGMLHKAKRFMDGMPIELCVHMEEFHVGMPLAWGCEDDNVCHGPCLRVAAFRQCNIHAYVYCVL
ncbi:hypothetical protein AMTRI_Chr05g59420 [Amborella trichopoda]